MNRKILFAVAAAITLGLGGVASADTVSINGYDDFTSTTLNFEPSGAGAGGLTGTGAFTVFDCTGCVDLTLSTLTSSGSGQVFYASDGPDLISFNLASGSSFSETTNAGLVTLTIVGSGELFFDSLPLSPGNFVLTSTDPPVGPYTFEAIINETPLPSTWMMFVASLLGLGLFAYRGSKKQSHGVSILAA